MGRVGEIVPFRGFIRDRTALSHRGPGVRRAQMSARMRLEAARGCRPFDSLPRVVAKPSNDARHGGLGGLEDALLPIANRAKIHAEQLCQVGLKEVLLETFPLYVFPDGLWIGWKSLSASPAAGIWGTEDLYLQVVNRQRTARRACSSTTTNPGCIRISSAGWRNWRRRNPTHNTPITQVRTTPRRTRNA